MPTTFFMFQATAAVLTGLLIWKLFDERTGLTREICGIVIAVGWVGIGLLQLKRWWCSSNSNRAIWSRSAYCAVVFGLISTAISFLSYTIKTPGCGDCGLRDGLLALVFGSEVAALTCVAILPDTPSSPAGGSHTEQSNGADHLRKQC